MNFNDEEKKRRLCYIHNNKKKCGEEKEDGLFFLFQQYKYTKTKFLRFSFLKNPSLPFFSSPPKKARTEDRSFFLFIVLKRVGHKKFICASSQQSTKKTS